MITLTLCHPERIPLEEEREDEEDPSTVQDVKEDVPCITARCLSLEDGKWRKRVFVSERVAVS